MTRRSVVYTVLRERANEWTPAALLVEAGAGWRYSARVHELRQPKYGGHNIESRRANKSAPWEYRLVIPDVAPGQEALPWVA